MKSAYLMKTVAVVALATAAAAPLEAQIEVGRYAPNIAGVNWINPGPGNTLADMRGRVIFLEFWATW